MSARPHIGFVHGGSHAQLATLADPALAPFDLRPFYLPEIVHDGHADTFADVDIVLVSDRLRPEMLAAIEPALTGALARGATVIVLGENRVDDWLPSVHEQQRPTIFWWWRTGEPHRMQRANTEHPAHAFFSDRSLIWHYHGVLASRPGAVSLVDLYTPTGEIDGSILQLDETTTPGRLLISTADPVYHHGSGFMPGATQLLYRILHWAVSVSGKDSTTP